MYDYSMHYALSTSDFNVWIIPFVCLIFLLSSTQAQQYIREIHPCFLTVSTGQRRNYISHVWGAAATLVDITVVRNWLSWWWRWQGRGAGCSESTCAIIRDALSYGSVCTALRGRVCLDIVSWTTLLCKTAHSKNINPFANIKISQTFHSIYLSPAG